MKPTRSKWNTEQIGYWRQCFEAAYLKMGAVCCMQNQMVSHSTVLKDVSLPKFLGLGNSMEGRLAFIASIVSECSQVLHCVPSSVFLAYCYLNIKV